MRLGRTGLLCSIIGCAPAPEPAEDPLTDACMASCGKLGCAAADFEADCEAYCETAAEQASEIGAPCPADLLRLFECLEPLGCVEYTEWYDEVPGADCADEEAIVAASCPGVQLR